MKKHILLNFSIKIATKSKNTFFLNFSIKIAPKSKYDVSTVTKSTPKTHQSSL